MADTFFITTAIDYTNGAPHIGHAYEKVLADVLARYHRLKGDDVFFLTGVDQHGQKVQQSAEKQGVAPQQFVDGITEKFRALWEKLDVRYDGWAATTDALHKECVRANLQMLWDDKDPATGESRWIYKKSEGGYYSVRQEQFLTDKERGADGEFGPEWQPVEFREEENFYFRLKDHKQWLLDFIDRRSAEGRPFVIPDFRVGELRNAVEKLEGDLCISRPKARLSWGIPFPEEWGADFVTFVWFDALVNYISFVPGHDPGYSQRSATTGKAPGNLGFADWWPPLHVIGKDIMIPAHGVYWPVMLKALGFRDEEMPTLLVHGWWNIRGKGGESEKMSKSLGNVVDPDGLADLVQGAVKDELSKQMFKAATKGKPILNEGEIAEIGERCGAEAVRYYLVSDIVTGKDADFSDERLLQRYNTDLANSLGNLLNRTLNMASQYRTGILKKWDSSEPVGASPYHAWELKLQLKNGALVTASLFDAFDPAGAIKEVGGLLATCDRFVESNAPWKLAKSSVPADAEGLEIILYSLAESLRIIAILLSPVIPKAAHGIFHQLNWKMDEQGKESRFRLADASWGGLPDGHQLGQPVPLFPRIELPKQP